MGGISTMGPEVSRAGAGGGGNAGIFARLAGLGAMVFPPRILIRTTIESENPRDRQRFIMSFIDVSPGGSARSLSPVSCRTVFRLEYDIACRRPKASVEKAALNQ
jgi:hypothetical protein